MIVLFFTGCSGLVQETSQETITPSIEVSRRTEGAPAVNISAGDDGWTLSAQQTYRVSLDQEVIQEQRVRRFVFWPPAILPGLIHCPISSLLYAISLGHAGEKGMRFGCRRLIMLEPLAGTAEAPFHITHRVSTETITKPLQSGRLEVGHAKRELPTVSIPLSDHGRAIVGYDAVVAKDGTEPFRGRIVDGQTVLWSGPWPDSNPSSTNHAIKEQRAGGHPSAWPTGTRIQIGTIQAPTPQIGDEVSRSLIETLVGLEFCILARPDIRHILNDELQLYLANRVSDRESIRTGEWLTANVLVNAAVQRIGAQLETSVYFIGAESGQELYRADFREGQTQGRSLSEWLADRLEKDRVGPEKRKCRPE
jgi:hypothetical protein